MDLSGLVLLSVLPGVAVAAQETGAMVANITRQSGVDPASSSAYVLIAVEGRLVETPGVAPGTNPRLIAQCSKNAAGRLKFELLAIEGGNSKGASVLAFQGPWRAGQGELFAPKLAKVQVKMEFLGYVKVNPVKRQWENPLGTQGLIRYATPGMASSNMEEIAFYLQYLRSLPKLRLTVPGKGAEEFETTQWQAEVKAEPLCKASGL